LEYGSPFEFDDEDEFEDEPMIATGFDLKT
jgi:hypothetical protein